MIELGSLMKNEYWIVLTKNKTLQNEKDFERELQIKLLEHKPRTLEYRQNVNFANGPVVGYP